MIYDNFLDLCNSVGKTPSAVALEIGISKTSVNRWKNGGGVTDATALKIARYFGITVDELKNGIKKQPSIPKDEELNKNDAVWDLREAVLERFPDYDVGQLSEIMDFIEGRLTQAQKIALDIEKQQQTKPLVSLDASQRSAVRSLLQELLQEDEQ